MLQALSNICILSKSYNLKPVEWGNGAYPCPLPRAFSHPSLRRRSIMGEMCRTLTLDDTSPRDPHMSKMDPATTVGSATPTHLSLRTLWSPVPPPGMPLVGTINPLRWRPSGIVNSSQPPQRRMDPASIPPKANHSMAMWGRLWNTTTQCEWAINLIGIYTMDRDSPVTCCHYNS